MAIDPPEKSSDHRHHRTRSNRQKAGVVAMQLLLSRELASRLDEMRGDRPRTVVVLEVLLERLGLDKKNSESPLRRGRPRKAVVSAPSAAPTPSPVVLDLPAGPTTLLAVVETPTALTPPPVIPEPSPAPALAAKVPEPASLELVNWERLLSRIPDPRREEKAVPDELRCWRLEGADGDSRLRWIYLHTDDPRIRFVKSLGGQYLRENEYFDGKGAWVLPPEAADACIEHFRLVDLQPLNALKANYDGWHVEVIDCGLNPGVLFEARIDLEAARKAVAGNRSRALGLALWLGHCRYEGHVWYRARSDSAGLVEGTLVSEPFTSAELIAGGLTVQPADGVHILHRSAPQPWREACAAAVLRGAETSDGLVRPAPDTGCPGHRIGPLLSLYLEAVQHDREPLLLRSEWDSAVQRASLLGVKTELVPRTPSDLSRAFDSECLPGWNAPTRAGHRLFPFQREAIEFALDQDGRCLIGDEMGLGKTASAIATAGAAHFRRVVVVCPLNAIGVWQREILAWSNPDHEAPAIAVVRVTDQRTELPSVGWTLLGYETLAGRDESFIIEDEQAKNALSEFFTVTFWEG